MKTSLIIGVAALMFLGGLFSPVSAAIPATATNEDFSAVSKAIVELLQSRDTARFASELSPAIEDWRSALFTNATGENPAQIAGFRKSDEYWRHVMEQGAKQLLAKADSLHVDFSKARLHAQAMPPGNLETKRYAGVKELPWAEKVEINLAPDVGTNNMAKGDFKLVVRGLIKFPGG